MTGTLLLALLFAFGAVVLLYVAWTFGGTAWMAVRALRDGRRLHAAVAQVGRRIFPVYLESPAPDSREVSAIVPLVFSFVLLAPLLALAGWLGVTAASLGRDFVHQLRNPCADLLPSEAKDALHITGKGVGSGGSSSCSIQYDQVRIEAYRPSRENDEEKRALVAKGKIVRPAVVAGARDDAFIAADPETKYHDHFEQLWFSRCGVTVTLTSFSHPPETSPGVEEVVAKAAPRLDTLCAYQKR